MSRIRLRPGKKHWTEIKAKKGKLERSAWVCAVGGAKPGPTLALIAGQHGMEPTGPAILSALAEELSPGDLSGSLLIVPVAYPNAIRCGAECEPMNKREAALVAAGRWRNQCPYGLNRNECGRNLNRLWHCDKRGPVHVQLARALWEHVIEPAHYVIDFHCWQEWSPPGVLTTTQEVLELGRWFGIPWIHHRTKASPRDPVMLASKAVISGRVAFTVEFTPQTRVTADMAKLGRRGIENIMRRLKMLPGRPKPTRPLYVLGEEGKDWVPVKAEEDVIVMPFVNPGDWVRKGQVVARVVEIDRPWKASHLKAPCAGIVQSTQPSSAVRKDEQMMVFRRAKRLHK